MRRSSGGPISAIIHSTVGIDVERRRADLQVAELARAALTEDEKNLLFTEFSADQASALLRLWTAKEALLKAKGGTIAAVRTICRDSGLSLRDCRKIMSGAPYSLRWNAGWLRNLRLGSALIASLAVCTNAAGLDIEFI